jgi:hypothetical protein
MKGLTGQESGDGEADHVGWLVMGGVLMKGVVWKTDQQGRRRAVNEGKSELDWMSG